MLNERAVRWRLVLRQQPRDEWIALLARGGRGVRAGVRARGGVVRPAPGRDRAGRPPNRVPATTTVVVGRADRGRPARRRRCRGDAPSRPAWSGAAVSSAGCASSTSPRSSPGPLGGRRCWPTSAPTVIKVEPPEGEAMRGAPRTRSRPASGASAASASTSARPRPGRSSSGCSSGPTWCCTTSGSACRTRLGIDEADGRPPQPARRLLPRQRVRHPPGRRPSSPGNDALMQAVTGFERAIGGAGNDPIAGTWIPIDMAGGWLAAIGILAGLYARATTRPGPAGGHEPAGRGDAAAERRVPARRRHASRGPTLDGAQTGYGPGLPHLRVR